MCFFVTADFFTIKQSFLPPYPLDLETFVLEFLKNKLLYIIKREHLNFCVYNRKPLQVKKKVLWSKQY